MPYAVVLDAYVLHPAHLRDTLLRLSERELFQPLWTSAILDELERSLTRREVPALSARRVVERSPHTLFEILDALSTAGTPRFADEVHRRV